MKNVIESIISYVNCITKNFNKKNNTITLTEDELWDLENGRKENDMPIKTVITDTSKLDIVPINSVSKENVYFIRGTLKILADVCDGYAFVNFDKPFDKAEFFKDDFADSIKAAKDSGLDVDQADSVEEILTNTNIELKLDVPADNSTTVNIYSDTNTSDDNQPVLNDQQIPSESIEVEEDDDEDITEDADDSDSVNSDDRPTYLGDDSTEARDDNFCAYFGTKDKRPQHGERVKLQGLLYQGYGNVIDTHFSGEDSYIRVRADNGIKYKYNAIDIKQQRIVKE